MYTIMYLYTLYRAVTKKSSISASGLIRKNSKFGQSFTKFTWLTTPSEILMMYNAAPLFLTFHA